MKSHDELEILENALPSYKTEIWVNVLAIANIQTCAQKILNNVDHEIGK